MKRALLEKAIVVAAAIGALGAAPQPGDGDLDGVVRQVLQKVCLPMEAGNAGAAMATAFERAAELGFLPDGEPPFVDGPFRETGLVRAPYELYIWRDDVTRGCSLDWPDGDVAALGAAVTATMADHGGYLRDDSGAVSGNHVTWHSGTGSVWVAAFEFSPRVGMGVAMDHPDGGTAAPSDRISPDVSIPPDA